MQTYRMDISYDGMHYGGWQMQPNAVTVQELIQNALKVALKEEIKITGSGRTDAGVHALQQTAHFCTALPFDPFRLRGSLNGILPPDIRIIQISPVSSRFHARYSAIGKVYHYELYLDPVLPPFKRLYCCHVKQKADLSLLKKAALEFMGTHDFTSFANEAHSGSAAKDAVRTIHSLDVIEQGKAVTLRFEGDGFLYKMVRNISGTLLQCAYGKIAPSKIPEMLAARNRKVAGPAAPPQGLFLVRVDYKSL